MSTEKDVDDLELCVRGKKGSNAQELELVIDGESIATVTMGEQEMVTGTMLYVAQFFAGEFAKAIMKRFKNLNEVEALALAARAMRYYKEQ